MLEVNLSRVQKAVYRYIARFITFTTLVLSANYVVAQDPAEDEIDVNGNLEQTVEAAVEVTEDPNIELEEDEEVNGQGYLLMELFSLVKELQADNAYLQGRVETLEHQVQELTHEERRRFAALDQRIRELSGTTRISPDAIGNAPQGTEAAVYREAFELVEDQKYEQAVPAFQALIEQFPNGDYVPDSMYWLGEVYSLIEPKDLEAARQQFVQIITLYPNHAKAPEAMYKLGTIYHELGDVSRALNYLNRLVQDYPDHTVSRLASDYIANLK